ncbi:MAG: STT3 domain-containing protein [Chloroflexota bacterium]
MKKHQEAKKSRVSSKLFPVIIVALFFVLALFFRVYFTYDKVFVGEWVKFTGNDAYDYMRLVDNLAHNFPYLTTFDPYRIYPGGEAVGTTNFFVRFLAGIIWLVSFGSPTQHTIDVISVYFPAVLGALVVIPVYFIGKVLGGRRVGILAAGLIAILPGEFISRSILGNTDQHVDEVLFATTVVLFLILALKSANQKQLTFSHLKHRDWAIITRPIIYSVLAGTFLGVYLLTWIGGLLLVFIISIYLVIQFIIDHLKGKSTAYLGVIGTILFLFATIVFLPASSDRLYLISILAALAIPMVLSVISRVMVNKKIETIDNLKSKSFDNLLITGVILLFIVLAVLLLKGGPLAFLITALVALPVLSAVYLFMVTKNIRLIFYPLTVIGVSLAGLAILYFINPSLLQRALNLLSIVFAPAGTQLTTIEMQPLLFPNGFGSPLSFVYACGNFPGLIPYNASAANLSSNILAFISSSFFLSIITLAVLIHFVIKQGNAEKGFIAVWSLVMLAATLGQRRFAYYLAVNVALFTGYLSVIMYYFIRFITEYFAGRNTSYVRSQILGFIGFKEQETKFIDTPKKNYYEILGISRNATNQEVRKAFRDLASKYQPDSGDRTDVKFKEINEAYQTLSNTHRRAAYDRSEYVMARKGKGKAGWAIGGFRLTFSPVSMVLAMLIVFFTTFFPNIQPSTAIASEARFAPSDAWCSSLDWLRENSPEPFGNPDYYYKLETSRKYKSLSALQSIPNPTSDPNFYKQQEGSYPYPNTAYGVLAWWDYGYWITRMAHRIPNANPGQDPRAQTSVAAFLTAKDEESANKIRQELGSSYVIIDFETSLGKFWAVAMYAGKAQTEYFDTYYVPQEDQLVQVQLFYPEYYRSISTRLYYFDGKAVTPENPVVICYEEKQSKEGIRYNEIITDNRTQQFDTYEKAEAYLQSQTEGNYRIVGIDPSKSPVPLEALEHYTVVHNSDELVQLSENATVPAVKIFKYTE